MRKRLTILAASALFLSEAALAAEEGPSADQIKIIQQHEGMVMRAHHREVTKVQPASRLTPAEEMAHQKALGYNRYLTALDEQIRVMNAGTDVAGPSQTSRR